MRSNAREYVKEETRELALEFYKWRARERWRRFEMSATNGPWSGLLLVAVFLAAYHMSDSLGFDVDDSTIIGLLGMLVVSSLLAAIPAMVQVCETYTQSWQKRTVEHQARRAFDSMPRLRDTEAGDLMVFLNLVRHGMIEPAQLDTHLAQLMRSGAFSRWVLLQDIRAQMSFFETRRTYARL